GLGLVGLRQAHGIGCREGMLQPLLQFLVSRLVGLQRFLGADGMLVRGRGIEFLGHRNAPCSFGNLKTRQASKSFASGSKSSERAQAAGVDRHPECRRRVMASENETFKLIGSDKVQGTAVYGPDGERVGSIERVMIEKVSGRVSYAVLP